MLVDNPDLANAFYRSGHTSSNSTPVLGIGDAAVAGHALVARKLQPLPPWEQNLHGVQIDILYRQGLFRVFFFGTTHRTGVDGSISDVREFSFAEDLARATSIARQIIAKLPLQ